MNQPEKHDSLSFMLKEIKGIVLVIHLNNMYSPNEKTLKRKECILLTWLDYNRRKGTVLYKNNLTTNSWSMLFTLHIYNYAVVLFKCFLKEDFFFIFVVFKKKMVCMPSCLNVREKWSFKFWTPRFSDANIH